VDLQTGILHIRTEGGGEDRVSLNPVLVRMLGQFLSLDHAARDKLEDAPEANTGPGPVPGGAARQQSRTMGMMTDTVALMLATRRISSFVLHPATVRARPIATRALAHRYRPRGRMIPCHPAGEPSPRDPSGSSLASGTITRG